ncbi:MAG TPA: chromosomal replication initiator protein DnaA [Solirubrobacterales bacterium]|nr:chromosomal replication initiator protein DnaA [Solirubrobacterales bacterium]
MNESPTPNAQSRPGSQKSLPGSARAVREWEDIQPFLRKRLFESAWQMWISPIKPAAVRGSTLYLEAPDTIRTWVERRYSQVIAESLQESPSHLTSFTFELPPQPEPIETPTRQAGPNPTHDFDRFVIGPGNHLAHAAALAVAEAPSEAYNPLFLHGSPGLGKTHLLGAVANYLSTNVPELNVLYTNAESFTAEFVTALREQGTDAFKRRYRNLDVLLIDDIQFIAGKPRTEEEFFHTFNALHDAGSQIVLSADRSPAEISTLADRLSDRFEWGLTVPLQAPNLATRLTVLRQLVQEAGLDIADQEALTLLARRVQTNLRQLRGALTRTIAESSLNSSPITSELVTSVFPVAQQSAAIPITPETIRSTVSSHFGIDEALIQSPKRDRNTATARHVAIYLTRENTPLSLPQIGQLYGGRDHTTVLNSIERVEDSIGTDPAITTAVEMIRARIHSPVESDPA